jgi:hypothetical protein
MTTDTAAKAAPKSRPAAKPKPKGGFDKGALFRLSRMLHAYLSAFAFLALIFFSVTGLTLNHPEWLAGRPREEVRKVHVPKAEIETALTAPEPERALAAAVGRRAPLRGRYASGEMLDGEALLRLEGPSGVTDITLTTATGEGEVSVRAASAVQALNDLHKGKAAGKAWSWAIDVSAVVFILLSVIGYVLFFSLRLRLKPSLALTAVSLALLLGVFWLFVG